jgi:hypothetical protein
MGSGAPHLAPSAYASTSGTALTGDSLAMWGPTGGAPGGGHGSHYPPGAVAAHGYTAYAQQAQQAHQAQRSTQDAWQRQTGMGAGTIEQRRSSSALFAILGVVAGLFLLAIVGGAGMYIYSKRAESGAAQAQADAAAEAAAAQAAPPPATAPTPSVAVAPPTAPVTTGKKGSTTAAASKDAGAAPASSASAGKAAATQADADAEQLARQKQNAQGRCSAQAALFRGNDPNAARTVKTMTCTAASSPSPNSGSSNCERANCRRACTILNDQTCILLLDNAERTAPLKF